MRRDDGVAGDQEPPEGPRRWTRRTGVLSTNRARRGAPAVEVELTWKTEARFFAILRHLLAGYDDVV